MPTHPIEPGRRFIRAGNPPSIWTVARVIERNGVPPHAVLSTGDSRRTVTLAVSVLHDVTQFTPAE